MLGHAALLLNKKIGYIGGTNFEAKTLGLCLKVLVLARCPLYSCANYPGLP